MKKLDEVLKQQNQSQSQNQQSQQQQQNQKSAQDQDQQQPASKGQLNEKSGDQNRQNPAAAHEMSPEEAQRLLDAQKGDEQFLQLKPKGPPESQNKPIKYL